MPKNTVTDPITDQEMAFAHLVLSGTMTDRAAAEAAGLNPDTAAYTKSKPRIRDYMIEHRNAVREKLVEPDPQPRPSRQKSTPLSGSTNSSRMGTHAIPSSPRKPNPPPARLLSRNPLQHLTRSPALSTLSSSLKGN
jgi:hypothetical protein